MKITPAGQKILVKLATAKASGRLVKLVNGLGEHAGYGVPVAHGDGAELAAAQKLARDGYIRLLGLRHHRYIMEKSE